jgi:hypothetical protein
MGFRDYSPGLNRFLTRDSYTGALADLNLSLDAFTGNRYAFAGGNPVGNIELDGHMIDRTGDYSGSTCGSANACEHAADVAATSGEIVHISEHVLINSADPRYGRLKAEYESEANDWLSLGSESRAWQAVCWNNRDLCGDSLF